MDRRAASIGTCGAQWSAMLSLWLVYSAVPARHRQGRHGLRRLQAVRGAWRLARCRLLVADHPDVVGDRRRCSALALWLSASWRTRTFRSPSARSWPAPGSSAWSSDRRRSDDGRPSHFPSACSSFDMASMRIGLTGGIGSGKSTVASMLVAAGAALIDTDAIARASPQPGGAAMPAIEAAFGPPVIAAGRRPGPRAHARVGYSPTPTPRRRLEAILHPADRCSNASARPRMASADATIVFDVPLLVESGRWRARVDRVLVVDATRRDAGRARRDARGPAGPGGGARRDRPAGRRALRGAPPPTP